MSPLCSHILSTSFVRVQVLYRKQGHSLGTLYTTSRLYIDLPLPAEGDYVVEVRAHTEGGDGAVAQIQITGNKRHLYRLQCHGSPALGKENIYQPGLI